MGDGLESLPDDIETLKAALIVARAEAAAARARQSDDQALIAHLKLQIEKLNRDRYGPRSERTARLLDQLELTHGRGGAGERPGDVADNPSRIEPIPRAARAGVADRLEHLGDCDGRSLRRNTSGILAGDGEGAFACVRIDAILHPAVLLALANGAGFLQIGGAAAFPRGPPPCAKPVRQPPYLPCRHPA
jgi:hypothetical protein